MDFVLSLMGISFIIASQFSKWIQPVKFAYNQGYEAGLKRGIEKGVKKSAKTTKLIKQSLKLLNLSLRDGTIKLENNVVLLGSSIVTLINAAIWPLVLLICIGMLSIAYYRVHFYRNIDGYRRTQVELQMIRQGFSDEIIELVQSFV